MKNYFFLMLALGLFTFTACDKDDDDGHGHGHEDGEYDVTVTIVSPADGDMATVGQATTVEVTYERPDNKIVHNVKVEILDADGNVKETLKEGHEHSESSYTFTGEFTPDAHGEYTLVATTTNDAMEGEVKAERTFMAMHENTGTYPVTIVIDSPTADATMALNADMDVKAIFTHDDGGTIHHVKVMILDSNGDVVKTLDDGHKHVDGSYTYEATAVYTADTAGTFTLRAMTHNMDMSIHKMMEHTFTVQ